MRGVAMQAMQKNRQAKKTRRRLSVAVGASPELAEVWFRHPIVAWASGEVIGTEGPKDLRIRPHHRHDGAAGGAEIITVDANNCVKYDSTHVQPLEDIAKMNNLHEAPLLDLLRRRYYDNAIYTFTTGIVISLNPYCFIEGMYDIGKFEQLQSERLVQEQDAESNGGAGVIGDEQVGDGFPPHVFTIADRAYTRMVVQLKDQSVIVSGESGAGKTEACKKIMTYLAHLSQRSDAGISDLRMQNMEEKVLECNPFLEAFGNAKTLRNDNSSRFGKFVNIQYLQGRITGIHMSHYLLEKIRVVHTSEGERNYHIFFQTVKGATAAEAAQYHLGEGVEHFQYLLGGVLKVDHVNDQEDFAIVRKALSFVGITHEQQHMILTVLAGVLHLGNLKFTTRSTKGGADKVTVTEDASLAHASSLLGVDMLANKLVVQKIQSRGRSSVYFKDLSTTESSNNRHALAKAIYDRLFSWLVKIVNLKLAGSGGSSSTISDFTCIGILDIFGFEIFKHNSFEQLCINYANEKLQHLFNHHIFVLEKQMYEQEGVDASSVEFQDNTLCIALIEDKPYGVLPLLDEYCALGQQQNNDEAYLSTLDKQHGGVGSGRNVRGGQPYYQKARSRSDRVFSIRHFAGLVPYGIDGLIDKNKDALVVDLKELMQASLQPFVAQLFEDPPPVAANLTPGTGRVKKPTSSPTIASQFKQQLASLQQKLLATQTHYIRCIKPNSFKKPLSFDAPLVLEQLLYSGVLETVRIRHMGYPVREHFEAFFDFCRNEHWLDWSDLGIPWQYPADDPTEGLRLFLSTPHQGLLPLPENAWQIGKNKIFLRQHAIRDLSDWYRGLRALPISKLMRGAVLRQRLRRYKRAVWSLQRRWRAITVQLKYRHLVSQCCKIQRIWKCAVRVRRHCKNRAARKVQCFYRARQETRRLYRNIYATRIQALVRGRFTARAMRHWVHVRLHAAEHIQATLRMALCRRKLRRAQSAACSIQALARGVSTRGWLMDMMVAAYTVQSFGRRVLQERLSRRMAAGALTVQRVWRGYWCRCDLHITHIAETWIGSRLLSWLQARQRQMWCFEAHAAAAWGDLAQLEPYLDPTTSTLFRVKSSMTGKSGLFHLLCHDHDLINARLKASAMRTIVHAAAAGAEESAEAARRAVHVIRRLVEAGAVVEVQDAFGDTPMHTAVACGDSHVQVGMVLLQLSPFQDSEDRVPWLLRHRNRRGETALDIALQKGAGGSGNGSGGGDSVITGSGSNRSSLTSSTDTIPCFTRWLLEQGAESALYSPEEIVELVQQQEEARKAGRGTEDDRRWQEEQAEKHRKMTYLADPRLRLLSMQRKKLQGQQSGEKQSIDNDAGTQNSDGDSDVDGEHDIWGGAGAPDLHFSGPTMTDENEHGEYGAAGGVGTYDAMMDRIRGNRDSRKASRQLQHGLQVYENVMAGAGASVYLEGLERDVEQYDRLVRKHSHPSGRARAPVTAPRKMNRTPAKHLNEPGVGLDAIRPSIEALRKQSRAFALSALRRKSSEVQARGRNVSSPSRGDGGRSTSGSNSVVGSGSSRSNSKGSGTSSTTATNGTSSSSSPRSVSLYKRTLKELPPRTRERKAKALQRQAQTRAENQSQAKSLAVERESQLVAAFRTAVSEEVVNKRRQSVTETREQRRRESITAIKKNKRRVSLAKAQASSPESSPISVVEPTRKSAMQAAYLLRAIQHQQSEDPAGAVTWWYKGDEKKVQGPFPQKWMRAWAVAGHLRPSLQVASSFAGRYESLSALFPNMSTAFTNAPTEDLRLAGALLSAELAC